MNKQMCTTECNPYTSEICTYCHQLPTQQSSLQVFNVGDKNSLEGGGGGGGVGLEHGDTTQIWELELDKETAVTL